MQFAVEAITVVWPCETAHAQPAENGHFVRVDLWATTSPEYSVRMQGGVFAVQFGWIDAAGITRSTADVQTMATYMCTDAEPFNFWTIGDGQNYVGVVILDVPTPTGSLILTEAVGGGWEWSVG